MEKMVTSADNAKRKGLTETVKAQIIGNAVVMVIASVLAVLIAFVGNPSPYDGQNTMLKFLACTIPFFVVINMFMPFHATRTEYLRGKWEIRDEEVSNTLDQLPDVWALVAPRSLLYGTAIMILICSGVYLSGWTPGVVMTGILMFLGIVAANTVLIKRFLPPYLNSFVAALKHTGERKPVRFALYVLLEHALPIMILQGFINGCIANRVLHSTAIKMGTTGITLDVMFINYLITAVVMGLVQWWFSSTKVRGDLYLGRIDLAKVKPVSRGIATAQVFIVAVVLALLLAGGFYLLGIPSVSVALSIVLWIAVAVAAIAFGAWIGVRFGVSMELPLMESFQADQGVKIIGDQERVTA